MELNLLANYFNDISWILLALLFGLAVKRVYLPPMVGYLVAGFVLSAVGMESGDTLNAVADIGVTILLFSIGIKLNIKDLLRAEIWAVSIIHMTVTVVLLGGLIFVLSFTGLQRFDGFSVMDAAVIAFALSFSSTVFAVKVLDEKGEMSSLHGKIAIGVLIMQDLIAVLFLAVSTGKAPSAFAVLLVLLIPMRPIFLAIMKKANHGELLILSGMALAFGGASLFDMVGIKADLGALLFGVLLSGNAKSKELAVSLLSFKEIFLVAFFLSIGFYGLPSLDSMMIAAFLAIVMLAKTALFYRLFTAFKLRARTSFLSAMSLSNYSEFGLIVGAISVANGWMDSEWLVIIAIALSTTFVIASIANTRGHGLYARNENYLSTFERDERLDDDRPVDVGNSKVLVFGMGRVGTGVYDSLQEQFGDMLLGIDIDKLVVERHKNAGRNVLVGDATDFDFWERLKPGSVNLIMLDMPNIRELLAAVDMIRRTSYQGKIAAAVKHNDCVQRLKDEGVDAVYNVYAEAGSGFANHVCESLDGSLGR